MDQTVEALRSFPDRNQNYWQLACIQAASLGLPGMIAGSQLVASIGVGGAITSVVIGNLILWLIGLTIISMAAADRDNAIQNVRRYLGKVGGVLAALFLIIAFLSWYILQISSATLVIYNLFDLEMSQLRIGATLGVLTALLSMGGIRLIKHFNVAIFPVLFIFITYLAARSFSSFHLEELFSFSVEGIFVVMAVTLPGIVNLPTFFRHSRSKSDSYLALSLMILFTIFFQISSILAGYTGLAAIQASSFGGAIFLTAFILLSLVAVNLVNIYFASAGWEMIMPHRRSAMEYAIVGLLGTMTYTFFQISQPMEFLENMASNFIASLGIILLMAFLVKMVVRHRPRPFAQVINVGCWLFGGIMGTVAQAQQDGHASNLLVVAISSSLIAFLCIVFIEETIWSAKKVIKTDE